MTKTLLRLLPLLSVALLLTTTLACSPEPETEPAEDTATSEEALEQLPPAGEAEANDPMEAEGAMDAMEDDEWVDPMSASADELAALPGMDATAAEALMDGRPYNNMTEVDAVLADHLDEAERETLYESLWMPIDLNAASAEEIELIPGIGPRMRHEFEEYRPYRAIEEFRREIGKYVNEAEVARLERYVELR